MTDNYRQQNLQHIGPSDKKLSWKEIEAIKSKAVKHCQALANVFRMREDWGEKEETRIRHTLNENSTTIPQVTSNPKDHKQLPDSGIPKARGVTGAS